MADKPLKKSLSANGQVILPLRAAPVFAPTKPEDVFGCLHVPGQKPKTLEEMEDTITAEVMDRHDRGRY